MELYAILRRAGWDSAAELAAAAERSTKVVREELLDDVRWIRTYALDESPGRLGTVCIFEARSPEAIRRHARRCDLPVTEIVRVVDTALVNPDPVRLAS